MDILFGNSDERLLNFRNRSPLWTSFPCMNIPMQEDMSSMLQLFSSWHFTRATPGPQPGLAGLALTVASALGLVGCAASSPAAKAVAPSACQSAAPQLSIAASQHINALPGEPGLPVQVRVYQLASADALTNTSFESVWTQAAELFGESLLDTQEYSVYPTEQRHWTAALIPEARTLAFVALFREPRNSDWFVAYDLEPPTEQAPCAGGAQLSVWLDGMRIRGGAGPGEAKRIGSEGGE